MEPALAIRLHVAGTGLRAEIAQGPSVPVERLILGRPAAEAAATLPRLFNLCRAAQAAAAHLALGLPLPDDGGRLAAEVLRDHMVKLFLTWPRHLGLPARPFPTTGEAPRALYGSAGHFPETPAAFARWIVAGEGAAPLLAAIRAAFAPGEAVATLPDTTPETALSPLAQENSTALRHPGHPVLDDLAQAWGRGPLWRAASRLIDAGACLAGRLPEPRLLPDGTAVTPAARGQYAIRASVDDGRVTAFARMTPTDHLLAPGGTLARSFASLPATNAALAPLLLDILDPCVTTSLTQVMERSGEDA